MEDGLHGGYVWGFCIICPYRQVYYFKIHFLFAYPELRFYSFNFLLVILEKQLNEWQSSSHQGLQAASSKSNLDAGFSASLPKTFDFIRLYRGLHSQLSQAACCFTFR
jgi:hypothetical protein